MAFNMMGTCFDLLLWFIRVCITIFLELLISESLIAVLHVFRWVPASWFVLSLLPFPRANAAQRELQVQRAGAARAERPG